MSDAPITGRVVSVHVGRVAPLGPQAEPSGFVKHAVAGPVAVGRLGLAGDEQADLRVHGGPEKAVYAYAVSHYAAWAAEFPQHAALFVPGGVGENLAITGMDEADICVGDVHAIGSARLQVCQPRQPCFKFALRFENNRLPKAMVRSGRSGWYYRVLQTGTMSAGDTVLLHARPNPDFSFARLLAVISHGDASSEELARMAGMQGLASQWQAHATQVLQQGRSAP
jgi:MOSC domain-containing protein YiiM